MTTANTGGPAFPSHGTMGEVTHEGMTLRDYFAAKALQGLLAGLLADGSDLRANVEDDVCKLAFTYSDKMLKARDA